MPISKIFGYERSLAADSTHGDELAGGQESKDAAAFERSTTK